MLKEMTELFGLSHLRCSLNTGAFFKSRFDTVGVCAKETHWVERELNK